MSLQKLIVCSLLLLSGSAFAMEPKKPVEQNQKLHTLSVKPAEKGSLLTLHQGHHHAVNLPKTDGLQLQRKKMSLKAIPALIEESTSRIIRLEELLKLWDTDPKMFGDILIAAFKNKKLHVIRFLLSNKLVPVDIEDNEGRTPLYHAISYAINYNYFDLAEELITIYHANLDHRDKAGKSILNFIDELIESIRLGKKSWDNIIKLIRIATLINDCKNTHKSNTPSESSTKLQVSYTKENLTATIKALQASSAQLTRIFLNSPQEFLTAAHTGNMPLLATLLTYDINVNILDSNHRSALHLAAASNNKNNTEIAKKLVMVGHINVNVLNKDGLTPLTIAAQKENTELVSFLINEAHADPNLGDAGSLKAIHYAILQRNIAMITCIITASKNSLNDLTHNQTPLDCVNEYLNMVQEKNGEPLETKIQREQLKYIKEIFIKNGARTAEELAAKKTPQGQSSSSSSSASVSSTSTTTIRAVAAQNNPIKQCPTACPQLPQSLTTYDNTAVPIYSIGQIFALNQLQGTRCGLETQAS